MWFAAVAVACSTSAFSHFWAFFPPAFVGVYGFLVFELFGFSVLPQISFSSTGGSREVSHFKNAQFADARLQTQ